ncbi:MAG: type II toxin-antitoxin system ParD family antitoxin [Paracoccaceae bacterium]|nr:type II toxin-antitoxin system ParD family antitoxin [Paracoccaceae bacterium]
MPTRNVVLTDHQSALIDRLVAEGRYQNASEALREGVRLLEAEEAAIADLARRADRGLEEMRSGAGEEAGPVLDRLFGALDEVS